MNLAPPVSPGSGDIHATLVGLVLFSGYPLSVILAALPFHDRRDTFTAALKRQ